MLTRHQLHLFWRGRDEDEASEAARLDRFLAAAAAVHEKLGAWYVDGAGDVPRVSGRDASLRALLSSRVDWKIGAALQTSYQAHLLLERRPDLGHIELACCIPRVDIGPAFVPNRLCMTLAEGEPWSEPSKLITLFEAAVAAFSPDFGHLGTPRVPTAPTALFSPGVPAVGWLTWLSRAYPPIPSIDGAEVRSGPSGTSIVAFTGPFDDADPSHRRALDDLRRRLQDAGVLIPAAALR